MPRVSHVRSRQGRGGKGLMGEGKTGIVLAQREQSRLGWGWDVMGSRKRKPRKSYGEGIGIGETWGPWAHLDYGLAPARLFREI